MHADTLRVTGAEALIAERRPPLIAVTFAGEGAPALTYLLEPRTAFEIADGIARLAMSLEPAIARELRLRTIALPGDGL